jgi:hypothetical protein
MYTCLLHTRGDAGEKSLQIMTDILRPKGKIKKRQA